MKIKKISTLCLQRLILILYLHPHSGNAFIGEVAQLVRAQDS